MTIGLGASVFPARGAEPFRVKDINPGADSSSPIELTAVNGMLFLSADDGITGSELWRSDGTQGGTVMVMDINPGPLSSSPRELTDVNGMLFLSANDGIAGSELWMSDGTEAGTVMVKDIYPGSSTSRPKLLTNVNGTLFFAANDGITNQELWMSDGTEAGTVMVKDIYPGAGGGLSPFVSMTNVNGTLFFAGNDGTHGIELWKSDGTEAGTVMVKDIYPGSISFPKLLTNVNGTLFFAATDGITNQELWMSDGTEAGTVMVKDIYPGISSSYPSLLTNVNGTLFFAADDGITGRELWMSDGTEAGTVMVKDINPGGGHALVTYWPWTNVNGVLFFTADDGVESTNIELWMSDGTEAGTVMVKDINPGPGTDSDCCVVHGTPGCDDPTCEANVCEEYSTCCSFSWYELCADYARYFCGTVCARGSSPARLTDVNGVLFFTADDGVESANRALWMSDGTEAGTVMVKDFDPSGDLNPSSLTNVNGILFFTADDGTVGSELWALQVGAPTGACCFGNGFCTPQTQAECESIEGQVYLGDGTECVGDFTCPAVCWSCLCTDGLSDSGTSAIGCVAEESGCSDLCQAHGGLQSFQCDLGPCVSIPTVSDWGVVVMCLLTLTAGTLILRARVPVLATH